MFRSAYAAYIAGILINVVGFAGASESFSYFLSQCLVPCPLAVVRRGPAEKNNLLDTIADNASCGSPRHTAGRTVPIAATRIYELAFFTGFGVSSIVYYVLNAFYPVVGAATVFEEIDVSGYEWERKNTHVGV